jgi:hypothetical protein
LRAGHGTTVGPDSEAPQREMQQQRKQLPPSAGVSSSRRWSNADVVPAVMGVSDVQLGGSWVHLEGLLPRPGDLDGAAALGTGRVGDVYVTAGGHQGIGQGQGMSSDGSVCRQVNDSISFRRHVQLGQLQQSG